MYVEGLPWQDLDITCRAVPPADDKRRVKIDAEEQRAEGDEANSDATTGVVLGTAAPTCPVYAAGESERSVMSMY